MISLDLVSLTHDKLIIAKTSAMNQIHVSENNIVDHIFLKFFLDIQELLVRKHDSTDVGIARVHGRRALTDLCGDTILLWSNHFQAWISTYHAMRHKQSQGKSFPRFGKNCRSPHCDTFLQYAETPAANQAEASRFTPKTREGCSNSFSPLIGSCSSDVLSV